ncbi:MAG: UDP-N-acetylglucosamine--N-acetylmuramyl-(pentapeptide) pyrophosphoryl-undecaprenol N-acetylglucosamine transferase [Candidatus Eremiobacteraeota bacterium]|nr:UDP-N-acetylglucosamine--N-acetylmuramyl-(pentapeptide) pyrophosphoryl-undecaprenol N-acetylglucosamine transferase [Candidatus Eremiobacteraeota bacterium]
MTIVFAGGGTGGHLYPAIAIAEALRRDDASIAFIGTADRLETTIVPKAGYELDPIAGRPLPRALSFDFLRTIVSNVTGTFQSLRLLANRRPDLVIATGGYVCFPVAVAARIRRLLRLSDAPIVLLEPNAKPGLTNRLLAPIVDEVWGPALEPDPRFRSKYHGTGVPIRSALRALPSRSDALARLRLNPSRKTLVAMGGSQGARSINDAVIDLVKSNATPSGWQVLALTGATDYERVRAVLPTALAYLDEMADAYAAADLILARAGASTLGELASLGKPAILVPYPHAAHGHQAENAARFEAAGGAIVLEDRRLQEGALPALLAQTVEPRRLRDLTAAAARLGGGDPLPAIRARIERLLSRRGER